MAIQLPFNTLSQWQNIAFSAALLERMLPNYAMFSEVTSFGDTKILRNQLDLLWQWLDKNNRCKINYSAQLTKLEPQIPDPEVFESYGVFPAIDTCMAVMSLLQSMQDKDEQGYANVSRLSENTVNGFVDLELSQEYEEVTESQIAQHPLMQWEHDTQIELFDFIKNQPENKATCLKAKALVLEEGISNLGIEI